MRQIIINGYLIDETGYIIIPRGVEWPTDASYLLSANVGKSGLQRARRRITSGIPVNPGYGKCHRKENSLETRKFARTEEFPKS